MTFKKVFLLLNGEPPIKMPNLNEYDMVCATDGAYGFLKENNISPDFISGDFDSLKGLPQDIEVINTPNQNYTDFDKILKILFEKNHTVIDVSGISTSGLKYPLKNEALTFGTRIGTRNVAIEDEISITFKAGHLFIFIND